MDERTFRESGAVVKLPMKHWRKIAWFSGDVYCGGCGRRQPWPCPQSSPFARIVARLPFYVKGE